MNFRDFLNENNEKKYHELVDKLANSDKNIMKLLGYISQKNYTEMLKEMMKYDITDEQGIRQTIQDWSRK